MSENSRNSSVIHATEDNFTAVVLQSPVPVLVKFGADWCPPCRMMEPYLEAFARRYAHQATVVEVNKDHAPNLSATYGVKGIPHLFVFKNGEVVPVEAGEDKFDGVGLPDYSTLRDWVSQMLAGAVEEPTPAETSFAQAAEAASTAQDQSISQSQASRNFGAAWGPFAKTFSEAVQSAKTALESKSIDQAEYERLIGEARKANKEAFQSPSIQALYEAYQTVSSAAGAEFKAAILSAIDQYFPAQPSSAEPAATAAPAGKGFCAIGDKTCTG